MRNLSLDQLRTLIEVVALGSFTEAAKRLHLTQPAISQQIRELENRCGLQLVERIGKRAFATPAGSELIMHGGRIMAEVDHALAAVRHHKVGTAGRVRIGAGPTALAFLLPPVLQNLRDAYPDIEITVTTGTTHSISQALLSNEIDLGFTALPVEAAVLDAVPVRTDPMVAILPASDDTIPAKVTPADVAQPYADPRVSACATPPIEPRLAASWWRRSEARVGVRQHRGDQERGRRRAWHVDCSRPCDEPRSTAEQRRRATAGSAAGTHARARTKTGAGSTTGICYRARGDLDAAVGRHGWGAAKTAQTIAVRRKNRDNKHIISHRDDASNRMSAFRDSP